MTSSISLALSQSPFACRSIHRPARGAAIASRGGQNSTIRPAVQCAKTNTFVPNDSGSNKSPLAPFVKGGLRECGARWRKNFDTAGELPIMVDNRYADT